MSVGVFDLNVDVALLHLNMYIEEFRLGCSELVKSKYISVDKFNDKVFFTVIDHFNTVPKSDSTVLKITKELQKLPTGLVKKLEELNIKVSRKVVTFNEPTIEEVHKYALSQGYTIDAETFIDFYRTKAKAYGKEGLWVDGRGKQVKDWKAKMRLVWFKDENKLKAVDGAPKGYEHFHIIFEDKMVFPESWKDGKPYSKNVAVNKALQRGFDK